MRRASPCVILSPHRKLRVSEVGVLRISSSNFIRWGGIAAVVVGAIYVLLVLFASQEIAVGSRLPGPLDTLLLTVTLLGQLGGIASLHVLQRDHYGQLGVVGSLVSCVGIAFLVLLSILTLLANKIGVLLAIVVVILVLVGIFAPLIGLALLGAATLRAQVLPSWFGVLLIVGLPVAVLLERVMDLGSE
jgi:hypothetical protein